MLKIACLITLSVLVAGCHGKFVSQIKGSGKREVQTRQVAPFKSLAAEGAFTIEVTCQKDQKLEIEGDDNLLEYVTTEVGSNILRLKQTRGFSNTEPVKVRISVPDLEGLSVNGAGHVDVKGLNNDKFEIDTNGAATIVVSGNTKVIDVGANGAGKVDAQNLNAPRAVVDSRGVARVDLGVTRELDVNIQGPSTVTYKGDPTVNKTIHGPGKVERRGSEGA